MEIPIDRIGPVFGTMDAYPPTEAVELIKEWDVECFVYERIKIWRDSNENTA